MRWILFLLALGTGLAQALDYHLQPRQIAEGVWLLEGSTDNFAAENGGNIVNVGFIETADGVVVIDTGPSRRYGRGSAPEHRENHRQTGAARVADSPSPRSCAG